MPFELPPYVYVAAALLAVATAGYLVYRRRPSELDLEDYTPDDLERTDPIELEQVVGMIWRAYGWRVESERRSNDGGVDFMAVRRDPVETRCAVQVKRYTDGAKVGSPEVQQYSALLHRDDVDVVAVVTTGGFSRPAREFASQAGVRLVDGGRLAEMLESAQTSTDG